MRFVTDGVNWDADIFIGTTENLLTMSSANSGEITPNIVESYSVNDELTENTFTLRKGMKWSDGEELTMEDVAFTINDVIFNAEINPVLAAYMRSGGTAEGTPMVFEIVDDYTFKISFDQMYGGFAVHVAVAGWKGYTEFIKPAHFLKPFHKEYADEIHGSLEAYYAYIAPFAAQLGYDDPTEEGIWYEVFNQVDMTNWELTDPNDALTSVYFEGLIDKNFPVLFPWIMVDHANGITTFERNPYYFKVDEAGNQLPYIDYVTSSFVEDQELIQLSVMTGAVDFMRESATIDNISLYKENEANANITAYVTDMHVNPCSPQFNFTYGLNSDGSVKDDNDSKAWQEMINDKRFLEALMYAIDAEEVLDSVFKGFGDVNPYFACTGDTDAANALLDEMGAIDTNGDGFRETPSGLPFSFQMWQANETSEQLPTCELYREYWNEIGINVQIYTTDSSLLDSSRLANEIPVRIIWLASDAMWHFQEWYTNQPMWQNWINNGGLSGELKDTVTDFIEPSEEFKQFVLGIQSCFTVDPATAVDEVVPALMQMQADNLWSIQPFQYIQQCVIVNSDIGNVPTGNIGISWNFSIEQMFFRTAE
jgi:peptide/nickel transport system substrate-binding protein